MIRWVFQCMVGNHLASLNSLQESVMDFSCEARTLSQTFIEAIADGPGYLSYTQTIHYGDQQKSKGKHRRHEPARLIKIGLLPDAENHPLPVPDAIPIA